MTGPVPAHARSAPPQASGQDDVGRMFVVGCPRAGTTLTQKLLGLHGDVYTCAETHYFQNIRRPGKRQIFDHLGLSPSNVQFAFNYIRSHNVLLEAHDPSGVRKLGPAARFFDQLMTAEAAARGKLAWVEKTPVHLFHIPLIRGHIPSATFVHVIREGRDVVASLVDAARAFPASGAWKEFSEVGRAIAQYNHCIAESAKYRDSGGHVFVQYEHILDDAQTVAQKLYRLLALKPQDRSLDLNGIHPQVVLETEHWKEDAGGEIWDTRGLKFERIFDPAQRRLIAQGVHSFAPKQGARFI